MLIRPRALSCALALSIYSPGTAHATDDPAPKVVVAGARFDARREETAASVIVNREQLLRHGDRSLGDALKRVAGITVGSATGRDSGIRLRGLGEGYTRILINGVAAPNGFSPDSLAPELIERIEIVRTASAELGTQSIAGTINIVLRRAANAATPVIKLGLDAQRGAWSPSVSGEFGGNKAGFTYAVPVTLARSRVANRQLGEGSTPAAQRVTTQSEMHAVSNLTLSPRAS